MAVVGIKFPKWTKQTILANGGETEINLSTTPLYLEELNVFLNGVLLQEGENKDYVYNSSKIIFSTPLEQCDLVQILILER